MVTRTGIMKIEFRSEEVLILLFVDGHSDFNKTNILWNYTSLNPSFRGWSLGLGSSQPSECVRSLNPSFRGWSLGQLAFDRLRFPQRVLILLFVDGHSDGYSSTSELMKI